MRFTMTPTTVNNSTVGAIRRIVPVSRPDRDGQSARIIDIRSNGSRLSLTVVFVICLCLSAFAQQLAPGGAPSPDEVALRAVVVKYFEAYAKKDLDAVMALWSD